MLKSKSAKMAKTSGKKDNNKQKKSSGAKPKNAFDEPPNMEVLAKFAAEKERCVCVDAASML